MADARQPRKGKAVRNESDELRRGAEERLAGLAAAAPVPGDIAAAIHELRVHQIELEMQNEELRRIQLELETSREKYVELFDLAPVGYLTLGDKGIVGDANLTAALLLGVERRLLVGQPLIAFVLAPDRDVYYLHERKLQKTGQPQACELRLQRLGGNASGAASGAASGDAEAGHFWARLESRPQRAADGETRLHWVTFTDITERKLAEEEIASTLSLLESTMESTADGILVTNRKGGTVRFNVKFAEMWGIPDAIIASKHDDAVLGFVLEQLKEPDVFLETVRGLQAAPEEATLDVLELTDGRVFERYSQPQRIGSSVVGRVFSFRDITARQRAEEALVHLNDELMDKAAALKEANVAITRIAATDHLTGLANRRSHRASLKRAISLARRHGSLLTLVTFDLDGLKGVNDSAGHEAGDEVLTSFAALLGDLCRVEDLPGRLGGDEFSLLLPGVDLSGACRLVERLLVAVRSCPALEQRGVTVSGGVAQWSPDERADDLLRRADEALYTAKRGGGDAVASAG